MRSALALALPLACLVLLVRPASGMEPPDQPNILFLLADDLRHDTFGYKDHAICKTPNIDTLASQSATFHNAFVTTAICMVSRATIFTGQYEARHGIHDFRTDFTPEAWAQTYPAILKEAGYHLGFIGKFGVGRRMEEAKQCFDFWRGFPGQGQFFAKGRKDNQHLTALQGDQALEFLRSAPKDQPWCLSISFKATHCQDGAKRQFPPDPRDEALYQDVTIPPAPISNEEIFRSLHEPLQTSEARRRWTIRFTPELFQETVKDYYRLLNSIDRELGRVREELAGLGMDDDTVIIFTSDHGFYLGERGLAGKWFPHEESIRIPLLIHDPRQEAGSQKSEHDELVLNLDLAPTIIDLAGATVPEGMQGESLKDFSQRKMTGRLSWRPDFFYEHHFAPHMLPESEAVRTRNWKYIMWGAPKPGVEELYDLEADPQELRNLAEDPTHEAQLNRMRKRLAELKKAAQ